MTKEVVVGIVTFVLSVIVSGIIGFYSAVSAIDTEIASIRERIAILETEVSSTIKPKLATVDKMARKLIDLESEIDTLERRNDIAAETRVLLQAQLEKERGSTLSELRELLKR